jgi:hypothetical protein
LSDDKIAETLQGALGLLGVAVSRDSPAAMLQEALASWTYETTKPNRDSK